MSFDAENIINSLNIDEKISLLTGADGFSTKDVERLGIRKMEMHDSPFGVRVVKSAQKADSDTVFLNLNDSAEELSTAFPTGCALGATFDRDAVREVGEALGEEAYAYGLSVILGPSMNIKRNPLCGRNFEYFAEDPCLSGELAAAYINGVQSRHVAACPKHFIANSQERSRYHISAELDERTMREIYLDGFRRAVEKSSPQSLMTAYNRINGVYASECKTLIEDILRDEWGFDGTIISDWGGVKNRTYSLLAGVDIAMPFSEEHAPNLRAAYENGTVTDEDINRSVRRFLTLYERTNNKKNGNIDFEKHYAAAYRAACAAMTLLQNKHNALPLDKDKISRLFVIGRRASSPAIGGCGSSKVQNPYRVDSPLEKIREALRSDAILDYMDAAQLDLDRRDIGPVEGDVLSRSKAADAVIIFASQNTASASEAIDRNSIELDPETEHLVHLAHCANKRVIVVLNIGDCIKTSSFSCFSDAILVSWLGGGAMGAAIADTLFGKNNPCGRTTQTFLKNINDIAAMKNYSYDQRRTVHSEGIYVGYRETDKYGVPVEFPFGFGLSYTKFGYSDIEAHIENGALVCSATITNEGDCDGAEIVQLYIAPPEITLLDRPVKELKDFCKVYLASGEAKTVKFTVSLDELRCYNPMLKAWVNDEGVHTAMLGASASDIRLKAEFAVDADLRCTAYPGDD